MACDTDLVRSKTKRRSKTCGVKRPAEVGGVRHAMRDDGGHELCPGLGPATPDADGDQSRLLLQHHLGLEIPRPGSGRRQVDRATDGWMPGEGNLRGREKDADPRGVGRVARALDEDRLGQVELAREDLHLAGRQVIRAEHDGQRIAREGPVGEDVAGVEGQHRKPLKSVRRS
jgi:hypothetical protein